MGIYARFIVHNIEYCENFNTEGILLIIEFEKDFDSMAWNSGVNFR